MFSVRILGRVLLSLVVVVIVAGAGLYVAARQQPGVAQGLKAIAASSAAAKAFDDKVDVIKKAADEAKRTGKTQPVEVSFTEEELTSKASESTVNPGNDIGITTQGTQIHLVGTQIIATSTVTVSGVSVNLGIVAEPVVVNGQTQIVIREVQTGALPIPDAIKQQINDQIGNAVDPSRLGLPIDVSLLQVVDGKLVIKGTAKP